MTWDGLNGMKYKILLKIVRGQIVCDMSALA